MFLKLQESNTNSVKVLALETVISYPHGTSIFSDSSPWVFGCSNKENLFNNQDMSSLIIISFFCGLCV